jgi:hypothetical protein
MITLPLAVDIADTALRRDLCRDRRALDAAASELRIRHPESRATPKDIADALRDICRWSGSGPDRPSA